MAVNQEAFGGFVGMPALLLVKGLLLICVALLAVLYILYFLHGILIELTESNTFEQELV
jgi:hypothetical protein